MCRKALKESGNSDIDNKVAKQQIYISNVKTAK
jgi:hypothetical protein